MDEKGDCGSKLAIVVTGVSKGLGRALALEFAKRGHTVIGCARSQPKLDSLKIELSQISQSPNHLLLNVDVTSNASVQHLLQAVLDANLVPDILVNNAAVINEKSKFWEMPVEEFDSVIDINIKGAANVLRHFIPLMIANQKGIIVNLSSLWGRIGAPMFSAYGASKWAIEGLSKSIAEELPKGMAIIALDPGAINTDMLVTCFGDLASNYPNPQQWVVEASTMILNFTATDNGASLTVNSIQVTWSSNIDV